MIFEFLIAYRQEAGTDIEPVLVEVLGRVLEDNGNEFEPEAVEGMIRLRHERYGKRTVAEDGKASRPVLLGFALDLPEETAQMSTVIGEFAAALAETAPIFHIVKFEDPLLHSDLAQYSEQVFALEMKLRRVLTLIYLHACQAAKPYDLLCDEIVQPMAREKPKPEQMKAAGENQFFHLTFGQYINLNKRPEFKLTDLLSLVRDAATYDTFREEVIRAPIGHEDDAVLLAGLTERMNAIETMRNCVAHNRRPNRATTESYNTARPLLDKMLDDYLARWEHIRPVEEPWETDAREAVERVLEDAGWDEDTKTIMLHDLDDDRVHKTVATWEELEDYLRNEASRAFYSSCPFDGGEAVFECDEYGIVEAALESFENRLEQFFGRTSPT